jgi:1-acyl-sn-glycerol-3-phosphate acyltransferase
MFYIGVRALAIFLFKVLFRVSSTGKENIPKEGGFIIASNHASHLDPPLVGSACSRKLWYFAKEELFEIPILAWVVRHLNSFPIKLRSANFRSIRFALAQLKEGKGVLIFPEGARSWNGDIGQPLPGIGLIAAKSGAPIIPAFIEGSNRALPRGSKFIRPTKISVHFGQPFQASDLIPQKKGVGFYHQIAQRTMQEIKNLKMEPHG